MVNRAVALDVAAGGQEDEALVGTRGARVRSTNSDPGLAERVEDEAAANRFVSGIKSLTEGDGVWRRAGDEVLYLCVPGEFGGVGSSPGCQVARLSWKSPSCQLITIMQWQCLPELKKIDWRKDWKKKKGRPGKTKSTM